MNDCITKPAVEHPWRHENRHAPQPETPVEPPDEDPDWWTEDQGPFDARLDAFIEQANKEHPDDAGSLKSLYDGIGDGLGHHGIASTLRTLTRLQAFVQAECDHDPLLP